MENIKEEIRKKIQCFSKVAWSIQDIMLALDIGETKARYIVIALDKTKVKSETICLLVGIDAKEEVKRLVNILKEIEEE